MAPTRALALTSQVVGAVAILLGIYMIVTGTGETLSAALAILLGLIAVVLPRHKAKREAGGS